VRTVLPRSLRLPHCAGAALYAGRLRAAAAGVAAGDINLWQRKLLPAAQWRDAPAKAGIGALEKYHINVASNLGEKYRRCVVYASRQVFCLAGSAARSCIVRGTWCSARISMRRCSGTLRGRKARGEMESGKAVAAAGAWQAASAAIDIAETHRACFYQRAKIKHWHLRNMVWRRKGGGGGRASGRCSARATWRAGRASSVRVNDACTSAANNGTQPRLPGGLLPRIYIDCLRLNPCNCLHALLYMHARMTARLSTAARIDNMAAVWRDGLVARSVAASARAGADPGRGATA